MIKSYIQRLVFKFEVGIDEYAKYSCGTLGYTTNWNIPPFSQNLHHVELVKTYFSGPV